MPVPLSKADELGSAAAPHAPTAGLADNRPWLQRIQGLLMIACSAVLFSIMSMLVNVSGSSFATFQITAVRFAVQTACSAAFAVYAKGWNIMKWAPKHQHKFLASRAVFGTLAVSALGPRGMRFLRNLLSSTDDVRVLGAVTHAAL